MQAPGTRRHGLATGAEAGGGTRRASTALLERADGIATRVRTIDTWAPPSPHLPAPPPRRARPGRPWSPALDRRGRLAVAGAFVLWELLTTAGWWSWLQAGRAEGLSAGFVLLTALLVPLTLASPLVYLLAAMRLRRAQPAPTAAPLRTSVVVTRRGRQPWSAVITTIDAVRADTDAIRANTDGAGGPPVELWVCDDAEALPADEQQAAQAWCHRHRVHLVSRRGVAAHRPPGLQRPPDDREGPITYVHERGCRVLSDVAVHLDAGRRPGPGWLGSLVGPFADPSVGLVRAVELGDANAERSWAARAVLDRRLLLGSAGQATPTDLGGGPQGDGATFAVRTAALRPVGGIGAGPREDITTAALLRADGWRCVVALDATVHDDGPAGMAGLAAATFRHARTATALAFGRGPHTGGRCRPSPGDRYGLLRPLLGAATAALVVLAAPLGVVAGTPLLSPALVGPLLRCSLVALPLIAVAAVLHLQGPLRGRVERVASWELVLSWLTGWPSALAGAVAGLVAGPSSGNARRDGTTRPRVRDDRRLPIRTIAPLLAGWAANLLAATFATTAPTRAVGLVVATVLWAAAAAVAVLHVRERILLGVEPAAAWRCAQGALRLTAMAVLMELATLGWLLWPVLGPSVWPAQ